MEPSLRIDNFSSSSINQDDVGMEPINSNRVEKSSSEGFLELFYSPRSALVSLLILSFLYFLESFARNFMSVSLIPYLDYGSYEYGLLAGPIFTVIYSVGGVVIALFVADDKPSDDVETNDLNNSVVNHPGGGNNDSVIAIKLGESSLEPLLAPSLPRDPENQSGWSSADKNGNSISLCKLQDARAAAVAATLSQCPSVVQEDADGSHSLVIFQKPRRHRPLGKVTVLTIATFVFSVSFALTAVATTFWEQAIIRVVMGLTQSVITPFSASLIRTLFPVRLHVSALSIYNLGTYFAFSLSLSLGVWMYNALGWQMGYYIFGIIGGVTAFTLPFTAFSSKPDDDDQPLDLAAILPGIASLEAFSFDAFAEENGYGFTPVDNTQLSFDENDPIVPKRRKSIIIPNTSYDDIIEKESSESVSLHQPLLTEGQGEYSSSYAHIKSAVDALNSGAASQEAPLLESPFKGYFANEKLNDFLSVLLHCWRHNPGVYLACLATGVRLGGGYLWSGYTAVFFSELLVSDVDSSCSYSYDAYSTSHIADACSSDYPFCVDGTCKAVNDYPWHNKGMASVHLISFMSWVPLVGSACGSLLCGLLSDYLVKQDILMRHMSSIPEMRNSVFRCLISAVTTLLSTPFVCLSVFFPFPACYLVLICSGSLGETYFNQIFSIVTDPLVTPNMMATTGVALFMLLITILGGNATMLIPSLIEYFDDGSMVDINVVASGVYPDSEKLTFVVSNPDASRMQYALLFGLLLCYGGSAVLYAVSAVVFSQTRYIRTH